MVYSTSSSTLLPVTSFMLNSMFTLYVVILVLPMWYCHSHWHTPSRHHARQKNHFSTAIMTQSQLLTGWPSSATWVVHYTCRMLEIVHKIHFTHIWV